MSLIKWTPSLDPFDEMEKFMEEFGMQAQNGFMPAADIFEKDGKIVATIPLYGVDPKHLDISIENNVLTVKGQTEKKNEVEEKNYYRKEIRTGSFYRSIVLPAEVAGDKADAQYDDNVLTITVPKKETQPAKKIAVKAKK